VIAARTVERGKNPEDGTGEGLATLAHHGDSSAAAAAKWGTRRRCVRGRKKPRRDGSRARETLLPTPVGGAAKGHGRHLTRTNSEEEPNSTRGSPGNSTVPGVRHDEEDPRPVRTARGERPKPIRRYSTGTTNL